MGKENAELEKKEIPSNIFSYEIVTRYNQQKLIEMLRDIFVLYQYKKFPCNQIANLNKYNFMKEKKTDQ